MAGRLNFTMEAAVRATARLFTTCSARPTIRGMPNRKDLFPSSIPWMGCSLWNRTWKKLSTIFANGWKKCLWMGWMLAKAATWVDGYCTVWHFGEARGRVNLILTLSKCRHMGSDWWSDLQQGHRLPREGLRFDGTLAVSEKGIDYFCVVGQIPILDYLFDKNPVYRIGPPSFGTVTNISIKHLIDRCQGNDKQHHYLSSLTSSTNLLKRRNYVPTLSMPLKLLHILWTTWSPVRKLWP